MFNKIKRNLIKYFTKSEPEEKVLINKEIDGPDIKLEEKVEVLEKIDFKENEDKTTCIQSIKKQKVKDPKEKLKIKLQIIAKRTKSRRIREKNLKRLVNLFGDY